MIAKSVEEKYHVRGLGDHVFMSLIRLQVPSALEGQDVHHLP